ncbi:Spore germination protein YaaH [Paenibacillus uliginis N3/975]|uniref:Spore germination protein YaaH n=1 Tax=Paenibacillus uliginis N3/975 TaxID=1313296 RepID=A0A1X7H9W2_9BACL|nr:S-layer homology domain-containing protein [Paenibacillus uliginis]SMF82437.1 Spore germination protein YaaH [Paenibacillus uliginis N3/975]
MKKYILSLMVCLMLIPSGFTPVEAKQAPSQPVFNDISGSYAKEAILRLAKRGIVNGNGAGAFLPRGKVTRAEFTAMLGRLLGMNPVMNDLPAFRDVPNQAWYYGWVHSGTNLGIVNGKGERLFNPMDPVSRQEAAVMMVRAMKLDSSRGDMDVADRYKDSEDLASWARSEVGTATTKGWMQGSDGFFRPYDAITREETAMLLDRVLRSGNVSDVLDSGYNSLASGIQMGWMYNGSAEQYISYAKTAGLNTLVPRWYYIESTGAVSDKTDQKLLNWAQLNGRKVWGMLGNRSNAEATHQMLSDANSRRSVVNTLAGYVVKYKLNGINVDFENVLPEDRYNLTAFIRELSAELRRWGAVTSIDVSPDLGTDWTAAFDYAALGKSADYLVLMGYDEHWGGAPKAGSVSSLPWLSSAVDKFLTQVPASKAVIALPLYTREWRFYPTVGSEDISLIEQGRRIRQQSASMVWNDVVGQYEAGYIRSGLQRKIWTEDARSLSVKHSMVEDRHTAGFAYWFPGSETPDVWQAIMNMKRYKSYSFDI